VELAVVSDRVSSVELAEVSDRVSAVELAVELAVVSDRVSAVELAVELAEELDVVSDRAYQGMVRKPVACTLVVEKVDTLDSSCMLEPVR
jgi:hypothetical protein